MDTSQITIALQTIVNEFYAQFQGQAYTDDISNYFSTTVTNTFTPLVGTIGVVEENDQIVRVVGLVVGSDGTQVRVVNEG